MKFKQGFLSEIFQQKALFLSMKKGLFLIVAKPSILVGGQAVIEGVMMRVPKAYATAARDPEGKIHIDRHEFESVTQKNPFWKKPVFRGMASLYESMKMGMQTLQWSADIAMPPENDEKQPGKMSTIFSTLFAIGLALVMFMIGPYWITSKIFSTGKEALLFNLVAGTIRITFFVLYLFFISMLKDVKRLFQYHGAEHRVVYNFESGKNISIDNAQSFPTQHPRCGTSFMFIVLLSAILIFALIDTAVLTFIGKLNLPGRLILHLPLIPIVAGLSYEVIKFSARHGDKLIVRLLRAPGLWLQNITTQKPENEMVEVAITALKSAFGDEYESIAGKKYIAEAMG